MKNSKLYAFLIETIMVILFFSVSAAITLQLFAMGMVKTNNSYETNIALMNIQSQLESIYSKSPGELNKMVDEGVLDIEYELGTLKTIVTKEDKVSGNMFYIKVVSDCKNSKIIYLETKKYAALE